MGPSVGREGREGNPGTCQDLPGHILPDANPAVPGGAGLSHLLPERVFTEDQLGVSGAWQSSLVFSKHIKAISLLQ